jgi:4-hydroxy-tetrahydrodipicolinate synthase
MTFDYRGVIVSQVTPFTERGELDESCLCRLIDRQLAAGVHGFLIAGNCGEFVGLTDEERIKAAAITAKQVAGIVPVIAGDFHSDTGQAVALARGYREVGVDTVLLTPPYFLRPSVDGIIEYYGDVARNGGLPVIVYNNPGRTGTDLTPPIMRKLYGVPGVIGLKECSRDLAQMAQKAQERPEGFAILYGDDDMFLESLMMGAVGGILAAANLVPETLLEIYRAYADPKGDLRRASDLQNRLLPMILSWYTVNHPGPLKQAMAMIGQPVGAVRKPLQPASPQQVEEMRQTLGSLGLLK